MIQLLPFSVCNRLGHFERDLETGVTKCRLCQCLTFAAATNDQLERYLLGVQSSTALNTEEPADE